MAPSRLKLLKLGALVRISVQRIKLAMASACPWQHEFALAHARCAECRRLTRTRHRTINRSTDVAAAGPATTLAQTHRLMTFLHPRHADNASQPRPALTASPV